MEYIFEKSILTELTGGGCKKNVINRLDKAWKDECKRQRLTNDVDYISKCLGISHTTIPDKPPLATYQQEGKLAETALIDELSFRYRIGTDLIDSSKIDCYNDFKEIIPDGTALVFNSSNRGKIKLNKSTFDNEDFIIDFSKKNALNIDHFKNIMDPSKYDYVYQFKFYVENDFYFSLVKEKSSLLLLKKYNITFRNLVPDLIRIIDCSNTQYNVFDKNFNIIKSSNSKIKLQVCDIKMADFTNKFFIELGLYMLALNSFIFSNGLSDCFEVIAEGMILPKRNNESEKEKEDRLKDPSYTLERWPCSFSTVKDKLVQLFNKDILDTINIIEMGNTKEYNNLKITPKCQTCDNYGGQYSDNLKRYIEKSNLKNGTNHTIEQFYNDPQNQYCRYTVINSGDINNIPCLKNGEKNILKKNGVDNIGKLEYELSNPSSKVFKENIALKSDYEILKHNIDVRQSGGDFQYIKDSRTMNMPKRSDLKIYIDERHDSQGRSLAFSFIYQFEGKDEFGNDINENNFKNPYIAIIDDDEFTAFREKREFIDYLIEINLILNKYDSYTSKYGEVPAFSIIYWGKKCIEHLKDLFIDVFAYLKARGDNIEVLYGTLTPTELNKKKKAVGKLLDRFNSFFTPDNELEDYRIVERTPFYNLKAAIEDIVVLNINISNTLYSVNNKLTSEDKTALYHKPDSDDFNGWIFSRVWKPWINSVERRKFIASLERVLTDRLFCIFRIAINLDRSYFKGQAPNIPQLQRMQMFPGLKFGIDLFLLHKLNAAYSFIEKENIHTLQTHKKTVLGKSMLLSKELIKSKDKILKKHFGSSAYNPSLYKVYKVNKNSLDANYDEQAFALTIYPANKGENIYMKFSAKPLTNCIYFNSNTDLVGVNLYSYNKDTGKSTIKNYRQAVQVRIINFDRISGHIILKLERDTIQIINFLESKHGFDFSKEVILESTHVDVWESRLKECLTRVEKDTTAKKILESYDPTPVNTVNVKKVQAVIANYYPGTSVPLDSSQLNAIANILNQKLTLLWGPPGTGKSHTVSHMLLAYYAMLGNKEQKRILVMGNYDATDNIIKNCSKVLDRRDVSIVRIKSKGRENGNFGPFLNLSYTEFEVDTDNPNFVSLKESILKQTNKLQIFTSTPQQMIKAFKSRIRSFMFDFVIVDEASQMDVGHFVASLIKISSNTQFLLAGDNLQLSPITNVKLKEPGKNIYGSVFDYYNNEFSEQYPNIRSELLFNRRSNRVIVDFSKAAFNYPIGYKADAGNELGKIKFAKPLSGANFYDSILDPEYPIVMLNYEDGNSSQLNTFEAEQVVEIVKNIWENQLYEYGKVKSPYTIFEFFDKGIGIVVPHRAQRSKIQSMLVEYFNKITTLITTTAKDKTILRDKIMSAVDTVEKYQGQQREIMICSFVLGDEDVIAQEQEFIYNPNRLNVMISRARFKAIILASNELISNVSDSIEVIDLQKSLQELVTYCNKQHIVTDKTWIAKKGTLRYASF